MSESIRRHRTYAAWYGLAQLIAGEKSEMAGKIRGECAFSFSVE
jgi:hypothetical protein